MLAMNAKSSIARPHASKPSLFQFVARLQLAASLLMVASLLSACGGEPAGTPIAASAAAATAADVREQALRGNGAYELVSSLTTEVGPRLAGSDGDRRAVQWATDAFHRLGFDDVQLQPVMVPQWIRGSASGQIVSPFPQPMVVVALGGSVATPPEGIEAEVLRLENLEALETTDAAEVAGKIVFFDGGWMPRRQDGGGYGTAVKPRAQGAAKAAAKGALAVIMRSAGTSEDRIAHTGSNRYSEDSPRIPAAALSNPDADMLAEQLSRGAVTFRLQLDTEEREPVESANVIAELRGRELPDEIVLLGAHLDSWDLGTGAIDDGAGCAIVMEAARLISELPQRPRRTIRVVLFANEEFGLDGAKAYTLEREDELARHVAAVEADFGAGRVWRFRSWVDPQAVPAVEEIASVLEPLGVEFLGNEARGGADLSKMSDARVPVFDLSQDGTHYFDVHHTVNDTIQRVDREDIAQNVAAYAAFAYMAAEMDADFRPSPIRPADND